jgi:predicted Fe-S protein YdhL (DUF1289 family)
MAATGWCEGCWRSLDEIAAWSSLGDLERRRICKQLPLRRAGAGGAAGADAPGSVGGSDRRGGAPDAGEHE